MKTIYQMVYTGIATLLISGCTATGYQSDFNNHLAPDDIYFLNLERKNKVGSQTIVHRRSAPNIHTKRKYRTKAIEDMTYYTGSGTGNPYIMKHDRGIKKRYKIVAQDMPVNKFLYYIFQEVLVNDFSIDPRIKTIREKVTLKIDKRLTRSELVNLLKDLLKNYNVQIEEKDHVFRATYTKKFPREAKGGNLITTQQILSNISDDTIVSQYIELNYMKANDFINLAAGLFFKDVTIKTFKDQNGFIINGRYAEIKKVLNFKKTVDRPFMSQKHTTLLYFKYIVPSDFEKEFNKILKFQNIDDIHTVPLDTINALMVITSNKNSLRFVMKWKEKFDTFRKGNDTQETYFYSSKYRSIEEIYNLLNQFNSDTPLSTKTQKTNKTSTDRKDALKKEFVKTEKQDTNIKASTSKQSKLMPSTLQNGVKIIPDISRNMLIIRATPIEYKKILDILHKIDTQPLQLLVEANIIEVTLKNDLQYGMEWFLKNKAQADGGDANAIKLIGQTQTGIGNGGFFGIVSNNYFNMMLNLFAQKNLINVLSHPKVLVLNGEEATIQVGEKIPTLSSTMSNITNPENAVSTVQYSDTGLTLNVKPSVTANGVIMMDIAQVISKGQKNGLSNISSPIILNRQISTKLVLRDNQSVIMGGLIQQDVSTTHTKVPFFSALPGVGNLFKSTSNNKTKTELVLLIKVHIIDDFALLDEVKTKFNRILSQTETENNFCKTNNISIQHRSVENIDLPEETDTNPAEIIQTIEPIKIKTKIKKKKLKNHTRKNRKRKIRKKSIISSRIYNANDENIEDLPLATTIPVSHKHTDGSQKSLEDLPLAKTYPAE